MKNLLEKGKNNKKIKQVRRIKNMKKNLKVIEGEMVPIYENEKGGKWINARELHSALQNKRKFADWIKQRIEQYDFIENQEFWTFSQICEKPIGGRPSREYYLNINMAKELCMVENNSIGKRLRKYFIEVEKRYRSIIEQPQNIFDIMHLALKQIEENEKKLNLVENTSKENKSEIENIKKKIDVIIQKKLLLSIRYSRAITYLFRKQFTSQ